MQERENEASNQGKELEEKWLDPFEKDYEEQPADSNDIVLFFFCSTCDFITPTTEYDYAV